MTAWAACIPAAECEALASLRLQPGMECAEIGGLIWLRGPALNEDLEGKLARIAGLERFEVLASNRLRPVHSRIPHGILPSLTWRSLNESLVPALPIASLAGENRQKLALTLVRGYAEQKPAALLITLEAWTDYAIQAPQVRLEPLTFAVAEDRQTLVLGQPLPPLPGLRLVNHAGILVPSGYAWSPTVHTAVLREVLELGPKDVAILAPDGTQQVVRAEQFVRASRSAVRMTTREVADV